MPLSPSVQHTRLDNGDTLFYARQKMAAPAGALSIRQVNFFLPALVLSNPADATQGCTPTVQVTIDTLGGGTLDTMVVYNVQTSLLDGMTEIGVSAQNIRGEYDLAGDFYCNLTVIGKPAAKK